MSDWTSGYVADVGYTFGYYQELNPQRVKLAFLNAGLIPPEFGNACELGFGQGLSANIHAASSLCTWHGTDFNPAQASFAKELASSSDANAHIFDESFSEFFSRDLPAFDYIGLHGIWSWISDENRQCIVEFIRKKLKAGGVLYISYNTLPGWGTFAPMRHLMTEHAEVISSNGAGIVKRIDSALDFTEKLIATNPLFSRANPHVAEKIKQIKGQNRHYLAHEYFNRDWYPMHFATMEKYMESAKLTYACSAHYLDHLEAVNLTSDQQSFLHDIQDPSFKQTVRDFMVNQQFRKDYWVKGARTLNQFDQAELLRKQRFVLSSYSPEVELKVTGSLGEGTLAENIYVPILDVMSDLKIRTLAEIEEAVQNKDIAFNQLVQAILVFCGNGTLSAAQDDDQITRSKLSSDKLNMHLMLKARSSHEISFLASPVTGGGVVAPRFQQLFLLAMRQGMETPEEWVNLVAQILSSQGQKIIKEGKILQTEDEQLAELSSQANQFAQKKLPILKALQIA